ncbi:MAG: DUF1648 domain-containing protein [Acidobacteria bacterium]|nr:DUF1648 domain-containing protein [Acidobacteriota bacterium]
MNRTILLVDCFAILLLILGWWVAFASYPGLPPKIPTHFNFRGEVDAMGASWMIFLIPATSTVIYIFNYFAFRSAVSSGKLPASALLPQHCLLLELAFIFTYITWRTCEIAFGRARGIGNKVILISIALVFLTVIWQVMAKRGRG